MALDLNSLYALLAGGLAGGGLLLLIVALRGIQGRDPSPAPGAAGEQRPWLLRALVDRLRTRMPLPAALERFANELNDPSADLIVASLILNSRVRGPGLREVLTSLSRSARDELDMRRRVVAQRRSTRRSVQIVVGVTLLVVAALVLFNRPYVEPDTTIQGQLVLILVLLLFAAGFVWLKRLSGFDAPSRFMFGGRGEAWQRTP